MSIIKRRPSRFTVICREACETLGADALAILAYLAGKPDDWEVTFSDLQSRFGWGEYKTRKAMKELCAKGYARRIEVRDNTGRIHGRRYDVANEPIFADMQSLQSLQDCKNSKLGKTNGYTEERLNNRKHRQRQNTEGALPRAACAADVSDCDASQRTDSVLESLTTQLAQPSQPSSEPRMTESEDADRPSRKVTNDQLDSMERELRAAAGVEHEPSPALFDLSPVLRLMDEGHTFDEILAAARVARGRGRPIRSWRYLEPIVRETASKRGKNAGTNGSRASMSESLPVANPADMTHDQWAMLLEHCRNRMIWPRALGPRPGEDGCKAPDSLLNDFDRRLGPRWRIVD